jgi:hypothetical protein
MEKRQPLHQMLLGKLSICLQKTETRSVFATLYIINSKWIKDLIVSPETLKLVHESPGNMLEVVGVGKDFLRTIRMAQQLREKIYKWYHMQLKSFFTTK